MLVIIVCIATLRNVTVFGNLGTICPVKNRSRADGGATVPPGNEPAMRGVTATAFSFVVLGLGRTSSTLGLSPTPFFQMTEDLETMHVLGMLPPRAGYFHCWQ